MPKVKSEPYRLAAPGSDQWFQIIGVVADARNDGLANPVKPAVYVPYTMWLETYTHLLVHTHGPPLSALHTVRIQVHAVDSDQQVEGTSIHPGRADRRAAGVAASAPRNDASWSFRLHGAGVGGSRAVQRRILWRCAKNTRIRYSDGPRCAAERHVGYRVFIHDAQRGKWSGGRRSSESDLHQAVGEMGRRNRGQSAHPFGCHAPIGLLLSVSLFPPCSPRLIHRSRRSIALGNSSATSRKSAHRKVTSQRAAFLTVSA
jgi:hypothetical protein